MNPSMFRKAALERLSSPEQLDLLISITNPRAWLMLAGLVAILAAGLVWGVTGKVSTTIDSRSILLTPGGIRNVVATYPGQIMALNPRLSEGTEVEIGQGEMIAEVLYPGDARSQQINSPFDGRLLELKTAEGALVEAGDPLLSLELSGQEGELESLLYLPAGQASQVEPGMKVRIALAGLPPETAGYLKGRVSSVAQFPSSLDGMLRMLGNPTLILALAVPEAPFEVEVELLKDAGGSYEWSTSPGPEIELRSGALGQASIILEEKTPIALLFGAG